MRRAAKVLASCLVSSLLAVTGAQAQSGTPITLLVGYSAGGSADFAARVMAPEISSRLGRPVVVENATGASGMIALQKLVNGRADTNTMYYGGFDTVAVPLVNQQVKVDWQKQTIPVGRTAITSMALVVPKDSPHQDLAALVAAAQAKPDTILYGTPGIASAQHFVGEMISSRAKIKLSHAPYRGGTQVSNDLLGGSLDSAVLTLSTALPFIQQGKVRALFVSDSPRSPQLPDVPALGEIKGFEGLSLPLWQGIFVKAGTPEPFVKQLDAAIKAALEDPQVQKRFADAGFTASPLGTTEFANFIKAQGETYEGIVRAANIKAE
jgi:tripartite-type tricarboxylate transporter receptor subunit TctC